jgi:hypothetical protein
MQGEKKGRAGRRRRCRPVSEFVGIALLANQPRAKTLLPQHAFYDQGETAIEVKLQLAASAGGAGSRQGMPDVYRDQGTFRSTGRAEDDDGQKSKGHQHRSRTQAA